MWDKAVDDALTSTLRDFVVDYVHFEGAEGASSSSSPSLSTSALGPPSASASPLPSTTPATTSYAPLSNIDGAPLSYISSAHSHTGTSSYPFGIGADSFSL